MNFHETIADRLARQQQRDGIPNKQPSNTKTRSNRAGYAENVRVLRSLSELYAQGWNPDPELIKEIFDLK